MTGAQGLDLLRELLTESDLSMAEFARVVVARDERTVRRWVTGAMPIPGAVTQWLDRVRIEVTPQMVRVVVRR